MQHLFRIIVVLLALSCGQAATLRVIPGPFRSGKAYVECEFDGVRESCFLDTGSAMTLVTPNFSNYPVLGTFRFKSASGKTAEAEVIQVKRATIDRAKFTNRRIGRLPAQSRGESTLGMDLLARVPFALEFRDRTALRLSPRVPRNLLKTLHVTRHGLLAIPVQIGQAQADALVDTGASVTAVDNAFIKAHPEDFQSRKKSMKGLDGTGQTITLRLFRAKELKLGDRVFRNLEVVGTDLGLLHESVGKDVHAVLGFNVLRQRDWYFDAQNRTWNVR